MLKTAEPPEADVRIIFVSSVGWRFRPSGGIQFLGHKTMQDFGILGPWRRYGQSQLANNVYATESAHRYPNITTVSVHPGIVKTDPVGSLGLVDKAFVYAGNFGTVTAPQEDVLNQLWAATRSKKGTIENGAFYMPVGIQARKHREGSRTGDGAVGMDGRERWEGIERNDKDVKTSYEHIRCRPAAKRRSQGRILYSRTSITRSRWPIPTKNYPIDNLHQFDF